MSHLKKIVRLGLIINILFTAFLPFYLPGSSQGETYDLLTFTSPPGFNKEVKNTYTTYIYINNQEGTFCVFAVYTSRDGTKNAEEEFRQEWMDLVVKTYNTTSSPRVTTTNRDANWKMSSASADASHSGQSFKVRLVSYTGNNKVASILFTYNSDKYKTTIEDVLNSVRIGGATGSAPVKTGQETGKITTAPTSSGEKNPAPGSLQSFGSMRFYLPPQWTAKKDNDTLILMPSDFKQGELFFIGLFQPLKGESDFTRALQTTWQQIRSSMGEELVAVWEGKEIPIKATLQGFAYIRDDRQTRRTNGMDVEINLYLVKTSAGMERIAAFSHGLRIQGMNYNPINNDKYYYPVQTLIHGIQFTERPLVKAPTGGWSGSGITGVWCGISGSYSAYSGAYNQAVGYFILLNNGTAYYYRKMPRGGLANLDTFTHRQLLPDYWGTYTFSNNTGTFTNYYYKRIDFALVNGKLKVTKNQTDHWFIKVPNINGAKLNGTYALETGESIRFNPDGTFYDNGALSVIAHYLYYLPYCPAYGGGEGTYEIKDYSIVFHYRDGRHFQTAFADWNFNPGQNNPQQILLGEELDLLKRR